MKVTLKHYREQAGLSQAALAESVGISRQAVNAIEAGKQTPSVAIAIRLARALGVRVEDIFDDGNTAFEAVSAGNPTARSIVGRVEGRLVAHGLHSSHGVSDALMVGRNGDHVTLDLFGDDREVEKNVLVAGCAPVLETLAWQTAERFSDARMRWIHASSGNALDLLERGHVHVAGVHLVDQDSESDHAALVHERFPDRDMLLVNLVTWREGLIVAPGNPLGLRVDDLDRQGLRVAWREAGAGAYSMLVRAFRASGITDEMPDGPMARGHMDVARWVASGAADVGVAIESAAIAYGLDFIPLSTERFDLVLPRQRAALTHVARVLDVLDSTPFAHEVQAFGGYDVAVTGHAWHVDRGQP